MLSILHKYALAFGPDTSRPSSGVESKPSETADLAGQRAEEGQLSNTAPEPPLSSATKPVAEGDAWAAGNFADTKALPTPNPGGHAQAALGGKQGDIASGSGRFGTLSLHTRVGLVLMALTACLLCGGGALWLHGTRSAVHEEVEAATRVAEQWLQVMIAESRHAPPGERSSRLIGMVEAVGRIRANDLVIRDTANNVRYVSPPSPYKAGRAAPAWFASLLAAPSATRTWQVEELKLQLQPDNSRAVLDAWDDLRGAAGWAVLLLASLFIGIRLALQHALQPLALVMSALDRMGHGRFETRLPDFSAPELHRLSRAFNGMADRLELAIDDNVRLQTEQEVAARMQDHLQSERRDIARELHDELAQGVTAVRALAGAIAQRTADNTSLNKQARSIVAVTGAMQDGVRDILHRLRQPAVPLAERIKQLLADWQNRHTEITLGSVIEIDDHILPQNYAGVLQRAVQEALTNVVRHADARRVMIDLRRTPAGIRLRIEDDGRGLATNQANAGSRLGLIGMRERVAELAGKLSVDYPATGGCVLTVELPSASKGAP